MFNINCLLGNNQFCILLQKQVGSTAGGLFAFAVARPLCYGEDPTKISWDQQTMGGWLISGWLVGWLISGHFLAVKTHFLTSAYECFSK